MQRESTKNYVNAHTRRARQTHLSSAPIPLPESSSTASHTHAHTPMLSLDGSEAPAPPPHRRTQPRTVTLAALAALAVFALAGVAHARGGGGGVAVKSFSTSPATAFVDAAPPLPGTYKKLGAGLLLLSPTSPPSVLLLQRKSKHHDRAWGLPGGNSEKEDGGSLLNTATREAKEEMGGVPPLTVRDRIDVTRGDKQDKDDDDDDKKFYAAYVATVADTKWRPPRLDTSESRDARWVPLSEMMELDLHPVTATVLKGGSRGRLDAVLAEVKGGR